MLGNFNMVERKSDKSGASSRTILAIERLFFNRLKDSLQISEAPLTTPSLTFSWNNTRSDSSRILARLDRFYIFPELS